MLLWLPLKAGTDQKYMLKLWITLNTLMNDDIQHYG